MGWNEPDKDKKPRGGNGQPPDLDELLKRMLLKIKGIFPSTPKKFNTKLPTIDNSGMGLWIGMIALIGFIFWALSGIFIVDPAEQAAILRFGKYVETVGPGPHWIPRFISSKMIVNVDSVSNYSYSAQMLTKDENLVSITLVVQYRIGDLQDYLFNVADPQEGLQQATSSALRQVVGTTTLDQLITEGREAWGSSVHDSLVKILAIYKTGIVIVNVSPQPARAPENVQDAFDDAIKAQEDEKRFSEQALAYEARVVPIAEGNAQRILAETKAYAQQVELKATGDVAEFLALLPEYMRSPAVTGERLYIDTMQKILSSTSKVLVDGKAGNLLYLPLDKLNSGTLPTSLSKKDTKLPEAGPVENGSISMFDGRAITRATEPERRSH